MYAVKSKIKFYFVQIDKFTSIWIEGGLGRTKNMKIEEANNREPITAKGRVNPEII